MTKWVVVGVVDGEDVMKGPDLAGLDACPAGAVGVVAALLADRT